MHIFAGRGRQTQTLTIYEKERMMHHRSEEAKRLQKQFDAILKEVLEKSTDESLLNELNLELLKMSESIQNKASRQPPPQPAYKKKHMISFRDEISQEQSTTFHKSSSESKEVKSKTISDMVNGLMNYQKQLQQQRSVHLQMISIELQKNKEAEEKLLKYGFSSIQQVLQGHQPEIFEILLQKIVTFIRHTSSFNIRQLLDVLDEYEHKVLQLKLTCEQEANKYAHLLSIAQALEDIDNINFNRLRDIKEQIQEHKKLNFSLSSIQNHSYRSSFSGEGNILSSI